MVELHVYHSVRFQLNDRDLSCPNILSLRLYQGPVGWLWPDHQSVPRGAGLTVPVPGHQPFRRGPHPGPPPTPRAPVGSPGTHTGGYWWSLTLNWRTNKALGVIWFKCNYMHWIYMYVKMWFAFLPRKYISSYSSCSFDSISCFTSISAQLCQTMKVPTVYFII